ncbi:hypothetical protein GGR51DRAFT_528083 [Nemania sp. FL0031]|nr:hypothetical protein GGR51DRAFT_528083 [Nemania sp. FL0031]
MSASPQSPNRDSILAQTHRCRHAFNSFGSDRPMGDSEDSITRAKIAGMRFEDWCWRTDVDSSGLRSLDERLRYASELRNAVLDCLDVIEAALADSTEESSRYPRGTGDDTKVYPTEDSGHDINELALKSFLSGFMIQDPITHVNDMIDILCRISVVIKPGISTDRFECAQSLDLKDGDFFKNEDERYINSSFPSSNPTLRARLLKASLERRRMLQYTAGLHARYMTTQGTGAPTIHTLPSFSKPITAHKFTYRSLFAPSKESEVSLMSYDVTDDKHEFKFPCFPSENDNGSRICPVCYLLLPLETEKQWREHILADLRPYVCTYPDCTFDPDKLYSSQRAWFSHELKFHRRRWLCPLEDNVNFDNLGALEAHVRQKHEGCLSALCREVMSVGQEMPYDAIENCPLCLSTIESRMELESHIGKHFAQIALMAITTTYAKSDKEDPGSGKLWTRKEERCATCPGN